MSQTLQELRAEHAHAEREHVRAALAAHHWRLGPAARELGIAPTSLRTIIEVHGLESEYAAHNPGPGRPKNDSKSTA